MPLRLRPGGPGDLAAVLALFDDAVAWLVSEGRTGQWGDEPWTGQPRREGVLAGLLAAGGGWLAETPDGEPAGFLGVGPAVPPVPPADVPEVYVRALVGSRRPDARGAGRLLMDHAVALGEERGVAQVRVDCYAGDDGRLVAFYESCGFVLTGTFTHPLPDGREWPGALLVHRLR